MAENNAKIHVLADETLGGIKREYVEVDRKAEVGEKIVIVNKREPDDMYRLGDVLTVDRRYASGGVESAGAISDANSIGLILHEEYHVLEPTDIVHIDGGRYELTDRKAEVGEKVIIVALDPGLATESDLGKVTTVTELCSEDDIETDKLGWVKRSEYRVLVPVESAEADEPQPADLIDVVSNLATRVADLERTIKRQKDEIDTLHKDNRTLGEELAGSTNVPRTFKLSELEGKTLKIFVGRDGNFVSVLGLDKDGGNSYVLFSGEERP
ncbi:hypothetical protein [Bacillus subtilis]|uniref:hypothetical protein n=1 Tax=Bacillus subtilis TaxID=1423 RepID=UPI0024BF2184|nr:hypothetical protein [Bacillus subtilis]MDK1004038.1 hypothetical protein [Bacillus subtilis]